MMSNYENWQEQLNNVSDEQKNQMKQTILASINEQIEQLKKEIEQYQLEKAKLVKPATSENDRISQTEKGKQEIEQAITIVKQTVTELKEKQAKNQSVIKSLDNQLSQGVLKAPLIWNDSFKWRNKRTKRTSQRNSACRNLSTS